MIPPILVVVSILLALFVVIYTTITDALDHCGNPVEDFTDEKYEDGFFLPKEQWRT